MCTIWTFLLVSLLIMYSIWLYLKLLNTIEIILCTSMDFTHITCLQTCQIPKLLLQHTLDMKSGILIFCWVMINLFYWITIWTEMWFNMTICMYKLHLFCCPDGPIKTVMSILLNMQMPMSSCPLVSSCINTRSQYTPLSSQLRISFICSIYRMK